MLIELRNNLLRPGSGPIAEELFGKALPDRVKLSRLGGFWRSEVGTLNEIINIWPFEDYAERERVRREWTKLQDWPPAIDEYLLEQETRLLTAAPFCPRIEARQLGEIYEMCVDTYVPRTIATVIKSWQTKIEVRQKLSPLVMCAYSETGRLNELVHIWAYRDVAERQRIRSEAARQGVWPPDANPGLLLKQTNLLMIPAAFSPLK